MTAPPVLAYPAELAHLRRIKAAALALALSEPAMRAALANEETEGRFDPWPEADALVAALKAAAP